jgi:hypothetical protein
MRSKIQEVRHQQHAGRNRIAAAMPGQRERAERPLVHSSRRPRVRKRAAGHCVNRAQIEDDFLRSQSSEIIARDYDVTGDSSAHRHADATGLYQRLRLISALDHSFLIDNQNE